MYKAWKKKMAWKNANPCAKPWWRTEPAIPPSSRSCDEPQPVLQKINMDDLSIGHGVPLLLDSIPEGLISKVDLFYCCAKCGKVFWDGSHFSRICEQFSDILDLTGDEETIYVKGKTGTPVWLICWIMELYGITELSRMIELSAIIEFSGMVELGGIVQHKDDFEQNCGISIAKALKIPQSCAKPLI